MRSERRVRHSRVRPHSGPSRLIRGVSRPLVTAVMMILLPAAAVPAQSLGELARQEEARRKAIKTSGKIYTNETIGSPAVPRPPVPAAPPGSPAAGAAVPPSASGVQPPSPSGVQPPSPSGVPPAAAGESADQATAEDTRDEAYWKDRIQAARNALARAEIFADALQSRINALTADFTARDDPAQRAMIAADRQKALAELDRVKQEIQQHTTAIADIQEEARRAGVPPGWLR